MKQALSTAQAAFLSIVVGVAIFAFLVLFTAVTIPPNLIETPLHIFVLAFMLGSSILPANLQLFLIVTMICTTIVGVILGVHSLMHERRSKLISITLLIALSLLVFLIVLGYLVIHFVNGLV